MLLVQCSDNWFCEILPSIDFVSMFPKKSDVELLRQNISCIFCRFYWFDFDTIVIHLGAKMMVYHVDMSRTRSYFWCSRNFERSFIIFKNSTFYLWGGRRYELSVLDFIDKVCNGLDEASCFRQCDQFAFGG